MEIDIGGNPSPTSGIRRVHQHHMSSRIQDIPNDDDDDNDSKTQTPSMTPTTNLERKPSYISVVSEANSTVSTPIENTNILFPPSAAAAARRGSARSSASRERPQPPSPSNMSQRRSFAGSQTGVGGRKTSFNETTLTRRKSTFRQTQLTNAQSYHRDGIHKPLMSRDFPQAKVPSIGVLHGFINFFRCDNTITVEKPPCLDTNDEYVHLRVMTEAEQEKMFNVCNEDEHANTIVLAPALLIGFLFAIVLYCSIIVFWAPDTRLYDAGGLPWRKGAMNASEAFLPMIMAALYVASITYANTLGISFTMFERQFKIEPEVLNSLQGREVALRKQDLETLANINKSAKLPFVRQSIAKKIRWYANEGRDSLPADLYINYVNSLAATATVKDYKISTLTGAANAGIPIIIAIAPMSARIFSGGSIWGYGLAEEFALSICGPLLSGICIYGVVAMLNLFAFTMRFHRRRMQWLTQALPDPTRPSESSWPTLGFDVLENVLIWHRMRSVILKPPMALYLWGRRLAELSFLLFILLVLLSVAYNFFNQEPSVYDGSTALTIALLITLAPMLLYTFHTPLKSTFLKDENVETLCRILLLSLKDIGLQRGAPGVTEEAIARIQDIRSAVKVTARSIASEEEVIAFLGFPLSVYTMLVMIAVFMMATGLVVMRGVYANQSFV